MRLPHPDDVTVLPYYHKVLPDGRLRKRERERWGGEKEGTRERERERRDRTIRKRD